MTKESQKQKNSKTIRQDKRIDDLKESLVYYKDITETIREPFIILNSDLQVVSANPAFYRKFKVLKRNTEGKLIYKLGNNQWDTPELRNCLENILPKNKKLNDYEINLDFPALGRKTMLLNARQVDAKQLIFLAIEDVSRQKALEHDSDKMTKNLINQRDRFQDLSEAKDEFISLASHQLRTPATIVKQYINLLIEGYIGEIPDSQLKILTIANDNNNRQLEIIEDLLWVAKLDAGKVRLRKLSRDVSTEIEAVIKSLKLVFEEHGQSISFHKPKQQMIASVDPKLMRMALENILDNAGKYSPNDTTVTVSVKQSNGYIAIAVKDKGVGIRKKDQTKLFKKFSRIHNPSSGSVKGAGLGLYWAKKVIDLHDGSIEINSTHGTGSTFTITLPAKE